MKRFQFEQEQVLMLRRKQRDVAEAELRRTADDVESSKAELRGCDANLLRITARIDTEAGNRLTLLTSVSGQLNQRSATQKRLQEALEKHAVACEQLRQTNANVEALEILRTEKRTLHVQLEQRKEQGEQEYRSLTTWLANSQEVFPLKKQTNG